MTATPAPVPLEDVVRCLEDCVNTLGRIAAVMNVIQERSPPGSDAARYVDMGWHGACYMEASARLILERLQHGGGRLDQADGNESLTAATPELHTAAAEVFALIDGGFLTVGVLAKDDPARVAACGRAVDALAAALGKGSGRGAS